MEFTAEDAKVAIRAVWVILSSPLAQRVYVVLIGAGTLALCLRWAIRADRRAINNIALAESEFDKRFLGPIPTLLDTFENQQNKIRARAVPLRRDAWAAFGVSFVAGFIVPTLMLLAATWQYHWLDPTATHLLDEAGQPFATPSIQQAAWFTADQTLRGGLFDLLEIFSWQVAALDNNPANHLFSIGVFGQHLFVEAFIFSGLLLLTRSLWQISSFLSRSLATHEKTFEDNLAKKAAAARAAALTQADPPT